MKAKLLAPVLWGSGYPAAADRFSRRLNASLVAMSSCSLGLWRVYERWFEVNLALERSTPRRELALDEGTLPHGRWSY